MWMYKYKPDNFKLFSGLIISAATGAGVVSSTLGEKTGPLGKLVDLAVRAILEDIGGNIELIAQALPDTEFQDYNGPDGKEFEGISKKIGESLKSEITLFIQRLPLRFQFSNDAFFGGPGSVLGQTLLMQDEEKLKKFTNWFNSLDRKMRRRTIYVSSAINNPGEFLMFIRLPEREMTKYIKTRYLLGKHEWIDPELLDQAIEMLNKASIWLHEQTNNIRIDTMRMQHELVGEYAPTKPPYYQVSYYDAIGVAAILLGLGLFVISVVAMQNPGYTQVINLPFQLAGTHPLEYPTPTYNWWGVGIAVAGVCLVIFHPRKTNRA